MPRSGIVRLALGPNDLPIRQDGFRCGCHLPLSHRRRLDHIYLIKVLIARAEDRASRARRVPRAPRGRAHCDLTAARHANRLLVGEPVYRAQINGRDD